MVGVFEIEASRRAGLFMSVLFADTESGWSVFLSQSQQLLLAGLTLLLGPFLPHVFAFEGRGHNLRLKLASLVHLGGVVVLFVCLVHD